MTAQLPSFAERVEALKNEQGNYLHVDDMADVIASLMQGMHGFPLVDNQVIIDRVVHDEILELKSFIENARHEIAGIRPNTLSKKAIPSAADELDAIVELTREAAEKILDAADELQEMASTADDEMIGRMTDIATKIFEASSFQDITGQRVTKVVATLQHIESQLTRLAEAIGDTEISDDERHIALDSDGVPVNPRDLLHGPQLPVEANAQDDIDAILASFD